MNKFESSFFEKYITEGQKIKGIIHIHFITIFRQITIWLIMGAILPSFIYYYSQSIKEIIPFYFLEIFLIIVFIKIIYDIFDWYNDVWIITNEGVTSLERALFKTSTITVSFDNIEGLEVDQNGIIDKVLQKGDLVIHKIGDDSFVLHDAIKPYRACDLIEEVTNEADELANIQDDKFDIIMDALGGVVENYLDKKTTKSDKQMELEEVIDKVAEKKGTLDLR